MLFHIAKLNRHKQLAQLAPILSRGNPDHAKQMRDFIREFILIEATEADLRQALEPASVDLKYTKEHQALISRGTELTKEFIRGASARN